MATKCDVPPLLQENVPLVDARRLGFIQGGKGRMIR
jgi:hypothetical protein